MSTLEEKSIAAMRAGLLKADSAKLCAAWKDASTVKGGNENGVFEDIMSRDVIAYTILRVLFLFKHKVFGGFIRAHYSGKPWNDIDIMVNMTKERGSVDTLLPALVRNIIQFIAFVLPIPKSCMAYVLHSGCKYGHACDLKIKPCGNQRLETMALCPPRPRPLSASPTLGQRGLRSDCPAAALQPQYLGALPSTNYPRCRRRLRG